VVTGLTLSFTDDYLEFERVVLCNAPDLDHVGRLDRATAHCPGTGGCIRPRLPSSATKVFSR
jgi:hypothetical protein